jgi:sugar phosphate isomerase/epimerase
MDLEPERLRLLRSTLIQRGVRVSGLASPVFKCALDPKRQVERGDTFFASEGTVSDHMEMLHRALEVAGYFEAPGVRIFSFWREHNPDPYVEEIAEHLHRAARLAETSGVRLWLENEPSTNGGYAQEVAHLVARVNSPFLRVLWDPGNERFGGNVPFPDGYEQVRPWIGHVHLKDAVYTPEQGGKCVPIGEGEACLEEQLSALERDGYTGLYTVETHFVPEGGTEADGTRRSLAGLRRIWELA